MCRAALVVSGGQWRRRGPSARAQADAALGAAVAALHRSSRGSYGDPRRVLNWLLSSNGVAPQAAPGPAALRRSSRVGKTRGILLAILPWQAAAAAPAPVTGAEARGTAADQRHGWLDGRSARPARGPCDRVSGRRTDGARMNTRAASAAAGPLPQAGPLSVGAVTLAGVHGGGPARSRWGAARPRSARHHDAPLQHRCRRHRIAPSGGGRDLAGAVMRDALCRRRQASRAPCADAPLNGLNRAFRANSTDLIGAIIYT